MEIMMRMGIVDFIVITKLCCIVLSRLSEVTNERICGRIAYRRACVVQTYVQY